MSLLIAVLAALGYAGGSTLQSAAVNRGTSAQATARTLRFLIGLLLDGAAWALSLMALRNLPVYVVQAILASSLAFTVVFARIWQHTTLRARDIAAISALIPALAVIALAGREQSTPRIDHSTTAYLTVLGFAAVAAVAVALTLGRRNVHGRASIPALLAGLSFSATALAARAVGITTPLWHNLQQPLVWVVVATGIAGTISYAAALKRGPVGPATAQLWAVEPSWKTCDYADAIHRLTDEPAGRRARRAAQHTGIVDSTRWRLVDPTTLGFGRLRGRLRTLPAAHRASRSGLAGFGFDPT